MLEAVRGITLAMNSICAMSAVESWSEICFVKYILMHFNEELLLNEKKLPF